ncbi:hypothetical protein GQX74_008084 [Glossina fuscipes]|nr:hypothetical protein GQX74_008084 [Glossina fuscipes]
MVMTTPKPLRNDHNNYKCAQYDYQFVKLCPAVLLVRLSLVVFIGRQKSVENYRPKRKTHEKLLQTENLSLAKLLPPHEYFPVTARHSCHVWVSKQNFFTKGSTVNKFPM